MDGEEKKKGKIRNDFSASLHPRKPAGEAEMQKTKGYRRRFHVSFVGSLVYNQDHTHPGQYGSERDAVSEGTI